MPIISVAQEQSQEKQRQAAVERLFRDAPASADWFAPEFLAKMPASRIDQIIGDMKRRFGSLQEVTREGGGRFLVQLERAEVPTRVVLDQAGRIAGLWFETPIPVGGSIEQHVAAIAALPGRPSVLVMTNGNVRAAHLPDAPLAVGSAAKLAVLKSLKAAVAAGRLAWSQVVPLDRRWRSLPTGSLQDWPDATPLTVATLANLMISISDNTATDALIHLVGRKAVESITPRNTPFLTTRELFILKASMHDELRQSWLTTDVAERRKLLVRIATMPLPSAQDLSPAASVEVEWFLSAAELCALLEATNDLPALQINPGLAQKEAWNAIAFKGGSELGVLNLSTRLVARDGTTHCVVATWNNNVMLEESRLQEHYRAILRMLGR